MTTPTPTRWTRDHTHTITTLLGTALAAAGLLLGRPHLVALAAPLLLTVVWSTWNRPTLSTVAGTTPSSTTVRTDELATTLTVTAPPGAPLVHLRTATPGARRTDTLLAVHGTRHIPVSVPSVRTGTRELFTTDLITSTTDGAWHDGPRRLDPDHVLVLPRTTPLAQTPVSARLRGLTGPHTSRRLGDGTELRDIAPLLPGDPVRRVDWRVTARRSPTLDTLYARRNHAPAEASVVLVIDSRDDVGPEISTWGAYRDTRPDRQTSLDIAREAAATIARTVLAGGDRVGLDDLGRLHTPVPLAAGTRHLHRIHHSLALARPHGAPRTRTRPPQVPTGALVYVFSTFLDDTAPQAALHWAAGGHQVIAVDTLPVEDTWGLSTREHHAWRLTAIQRHDRLHTLRAAGLTVVRWTDPSTAQDLHAGTRERHHA